MTFALSVVSLFFLIFTSLVGIYSLVESLSKKIFENDKDVSFIKLLLAKGDGDDLEWKTRALLKSDGPVLIVDMGLDEEGISIAKKLATSKNEIVVATQNELNSAVLKLS